MFEDSDSLEQPSPFRYVPSSASDHTEPFRANSENWRMQGLANSWPYGRYGETDARAWTYVADLAAQQSISSAADAVAALHAERREQAANAHRWRLRCESVQRQLFWTRVALLCHAAALLAWVVLR